MTLPMPIESPAAFPRKRTRRTLLLLTTTLVALTGAAPAFAQGPSAAQPAVDAAQPSAQEPEGIPDVTVTARRREENLQQTPVSATVLSGAGLLAQNIRNFSELRGAASNLEIVPLLSGGTSFAVRGVGQTSAQVNADSKAGFYVDEMYVSRQEGNDLYFYDVGSLQVLKGPQGTLFGKNTTAGAILLTTNRPTDTFGGYVQGRVGSYKRIDSEGAINMPLADGIYSRFSFRTQNVDGFIKHLLDDDTSGNINNKSARLQLRVLKGPLTVDLLGEYNESKTDGGATIPTRCFTTAPQTGFAGSYIANYNALHTVPFCTAYPVLGKPYLVYGGATLSIPTSSIITDRARGGDYNAPINELVNSTNGNVAARRQVGRGPFNNTQVYTANARIGYQITDNIEVRSISAYRHSHASYYTPTLDAPNDIYAEYDNTTTDQFTQELTLGGKAIDDRLEFLAGVFYYYQKTNLLQDTGPDWIDPLGYVYDGDLKYQSYAAFAQASFKVTSKLELTVGGRYTYDKKSGQSYVFFANNSNTFVGTLPGATTATTINCGGAYSFTNIFLGGLTNCAGAPFTARGKNHWDGFDPKVQLSYKWTPNFFTYITAAHGYNSGGFNQQLGSQPANGQFPSNYNPERLWSYEAGFKADLFDNRVRLNASGFYQDYSDIQSTVIVQTGNITSRQFQTAGSAREVGAEVEVVLKPVPNATITANGSYLDQKYTKIVPGALCSVWTRRSTRRRNIRTTSRRATTSTWVRAVASRRARTCVASPRSPPASRTARPRCRRSRPARSPAMRWSACVSITARAIRARGASPSTAPTSSTR